MPFRESQPRRQFLSLFPAALAGALLFPQRAFAGLLRPPRSAEHPEPRPGIDASKVLTADKLSNPAAAPIYDMIRQIPEVVDGIHCYCGCAELPGFYSLLTCYEGEGMAQFCAICQGQGKLVHSMHEGGNSLAQIRTAIDALHG